MQIPPKSTGPRLEPSITPGPSVSSPSGSWNRSTAREVPISELQQKFGWSEGSWQADLLKAADAASPTKTRQGNGSVSAAEVERYLQSPGDARFLTSTALQQERKALEQKLAGGGRSVAVDSFDSDWQDAVARRADLSGDGKLSRTELDTFFTDVKAGKVQDVQWMPDQKGAMFESKVAESAGELDPLRPAGSEGRGRELLKDYMRISLDEAKNVPTLVSHMLSAADLEERPAGWTGTRAVSRRIPSWATARCGTRTTRARGLIAGT